MELDVASAAACEKLSTAALATDPLTGPTLPLAPASRAPSVPPPRAEDERTTQSCTMKRPSAAPGDSRRATAGGSACAPG